MKNSLKFTALLFIFSLFVFSCSTSRKHDPSDFGSEFHTSAKILKIMEDSKIIYTIDELKDTLIINEDSLQVLHNQYVRYDAGDSIRLDVYQLGENEISLFKQAEAHFKNKEYDKALTLYKELYKIRPDYAYALTLIGDVFFNQGNLDSAEVYFLKAVKQNPVDYSAHWFLADTYWNKGFGNEAIEHITIAHVLNRNNLRLKNSLIYYRNQIGIPWKEWTFNPQYRLSANDGKVLIETKMDWLGYALAKALWKYEPGYAKSMVGSEPDEYVYNFKEEAEAVSMLITGDKKKKRLEKIVNDGAFQPFYYYEIVAFRYPLTLLLLPQTQFQKIVDYVARYH